MKYLLFILLVMMAAWLTAEAGSQSYFLTSCTTLDEQNPTTNYGSRDSVWVQYIGSGTKKKKRFIMDCPDISALADSTINSAVCSVYCKSRSATLNVTVSGICPGGSTCTNQFSEGNATWNVYDLGNNWGTAGGDITTVDDTVSINANATWFVFEVENIIAEVRAGEASGFIWRLLAETTVSRAGFCSDDAITYPPKLYLTYQEAPKTKSQIIFVTE